MCRFDFWFLKKKPCCALVETPTCKTSFYMYVNHENNIKIFLHAKLETFCWCCVNFASKFSPFNNCPVTKYIPFTMDMSLVILIRFWLLSPPCRHLQFLSHHHGHYSIKKSPNHLHLTQNFSYLCYSIHELCSHLSNQQYLQTN